MNAEYLHLLINHFPLHGLAIATLGLLIGLLVRNRLAVGVSLALIAVSSLSIPFVMGTGEEAYERYRDDPQLSGLIGEEGLDMAKKHYDDAETGAKATYVLIALGLGGLIAWKLRPGWLIPIAWTTLVVAVVSLLLNAWIASSGGKIRRPDFRTGNSEATASIRVERVISGSVDSQPDRCPVSLA